MFLTKRGIMCYIASTYGVHGEDLSWPVERGSEPPQLLVDDSALLLFPVEHLLQELVPADVVTTHPPTLLKPPLHHCLSGYPCVIQSWHPDHVSAQHPVPAYKQLSVFTFRDSLVNFCNYSYKVSRMFSWLDIRCENELSVFPRN